MADAVEDMKVCPNCAEAVKAAAKGCRYCGYDFLTAKMPNAAAVETKQPVGCSAGAITAMCVIVVVILLIAMIGGAGRGGNGAAEKPVELLSKDVIAQCDKVLKDGENIGAIRKIDRASTRLYVDDRVWAELGPDTRKAVAGSAVCRWFGRSIADSTFDESVMVVSWQSGKRLSMVGSGGYSDTMD